MLKSAIPYVLAVFVSLPALQAAAEDIPHSLLPGRFFDGAILNFLVPDLPYYRAMQDLDREFTELTGIVVSWAFTEPGSVERRLELSRNTDGQSFDIVALQGPMAWHGTSRLSALDALASRDRVGRASWPDTWTSYLSVQGETLAQPNLIDLLVISDTGPTKMTGEALLPQWFLEAAAQEHDIVDEKGRPIWSSPLIVSMTEEMLETYRTDVDAFGQSASQDVEIGIATQTPEARQDLQGELPHWLSDWYAPEKRVTSVRQVRFFDVANGQPVPVRNWSLTVPEESVQKDASWEFIKWATSLQTETQLAQELELSLTPRTCKICVEGDYPELPEVNRLLKLPPPLKQDLLAQALNRIIDGLSVARALRDAEDEAMLTIDRWSPE